MTVAELIAELQKYDGDLDVEYHYTSYSCRHEDYTEADVDYVVERGVYAWKYVEGPRGGKKAMRRVRIGTKVVLG